MSPRQPADTTALAWIRRLRSAEPMFVSDEHQRVVAWSDAATELLGWEAGDAIGRTCYEVIAGTEPDGHPVCGRDCRVAANARRNRVTMSYDVVARTRDGERIFLTSAIVLATAGAEQRPFMIHLLRPRSASTSASPASLEPDDVAPVGNPLSRRELEVLHLLADGRTTGEIAEALSISRFTARNHINSIERKLGARSRVEAVVLGQHHRLI